MVLKLSVAIATIASLLLLERKYPFFHFHNSFWVRIGSNFQLGGFNIIGTSLLTPIIAQLIVAPDLHQGILTQISSPIVSGIIALLSLDLYMYLWHRLMHTLWLPWQFHRIHHTDRTMNVSTAYRFHTIEIISSSLPKHG